MYDERIEQLISAALADGVLTEKEKQVLFKKAHAEGIDLDEFEIILDARLLEAQEAEKKKREKAAPKSDKYADVKKCPACGSIIPPNTKVCPGCGMVFSNEQSDIKEIIDLQNSYAKISKFKPNTPLAPVLLSIFIITTLLTVFAWIFGVLCEAPGYLWISAISWIGIVIGIIICIVKFEVRFTSFNTNYNSAVGEYHKLFSTAQAFYSQDKNTILRIKEINDRTQVTISSNAKASKRYSCLAYCTLFISVFLVISLPFLWFDDVLIKNSPEKCLSAVEQAINMGEMDQAEFLYKDFVKSTGNRSRYFKYKGGNVAIALLQAFIDQGNEEKVLCYAKESMSGRDYYDKRDFVVLYAVVDFYVAQERYLDALDWVARSNIEGITAYTYREVMKRSVVNMNRKGQKSEALKFINNNSYLFNNEASDSEYYKSKVVKELRQIVLE